ncbi:MAG: thermonuclease family protein [Maricaulaceae bacterium]
MIGSRLAGIVIAAALSAPARAEPAQGWRCADAALITAVPAADTVVFDIGDEAVLAGVILPRGPDPQGRGGEPFATEAQAALSALARGQAAQACWSGPERRDRWGRQIAHVRLLTRDAYAQDLLLSEGWARVSPEQQDASRLDALLAAERSARAARRGVWRSAYYAVRPAEAAGPWAGRFQIIEGVVVDVAEVRSRLYLNFGADWRRDFTVTVPPRERKRFEAAGTDWFALPGVRVRARGWVEDVNGPSLRVDHPGQLEIDPPDPVFDASGG